MENAFRFGAFSQTTKTTQGFLVLLDDPRANAAAHHCESNAMWGGSQDRCLIDLYSHRVAGR